MSVSHRSSRDQKTSSRDAVHGWLRYVCFPSRLERPENIIQRRSTQVVSICLFPIAARETRRHQKRPEDIIQRRSTWVASIYLFFIAARETRRHHLATQYTGCFDMSVSHRVVTYIIKLHFRSFLVCHVGHFVVACPVCRSFECLPLLVVKFLRAK